MSVLDGPDPEDPLDSLCDYCDANSFVSCCLCDAHLCRKHNRIHKCRLGKPEALKEMEADR